MKSLHSIAVKFGLIGSAVHIGIFLVHYFSGGNPFVDMYMMDIFILPVFLYFGVREFRDYHNARQLEFWQGMTLGLVLYVLLALLTAGFGFVFIEALDTDLVASYQQERINNLLENKESIISRMGTDKFNEAIFHAKKVTSKSIALDNLLKRIGMGFLLTSVISIVMKRKKS